MGGPIHITNAKVSGEGKIIGPITIEGTMPEMPKSTTKPASIIEGVAAFIEACPLLKDGAFRVDALGEQPTEYAIDIGTFDPVIETYIDGSSDRRYQFNFGSREAYDLDRLQNIANSTFYEDFAAWIDERDRTGQLPEMPEGCTPENIRTLSSGYLFNEDGRNARYQIQIELTYHKEA